jgi:hypothetical protein
MKEFGIYSLNKQYLSKYSVVGKDLLNIKGGFRPSYC